MVRRLAVNTTLVARRDHRFAQQNLALREVARQYARIQRTRAERLQDGRALLRHIMLWALSLGLVAYACLAAGAF